MQVPDIVLLGDERLRKQSISIEKEELTQETFLKQLKLLELALDDFRTKNGFGR